MSEIKRTGEREKKVVGCLLSCACQPPATPPSLQHTAASFHAKIGDGTRHNLIDGLFVATIAVKIARKRRLLDNEDNSARNSFAYLGR